MTEVENNETKITKHVKPCDDFTLDKLNELYEKLPTYEEFMEGIENGKLQSYRA